jgi:integrase
MPNHQPASHLYRALSAVCGFAGLRPGEAVVLEVEDLSLPSNGWGSIRVSRAWSGVDGDRWNTELESIAGPKTRKSRRLVPMPPLLVEIIVDWMQRSNIESGPLFLTRSGSRPTQSNWSRALARACNCAEWPNPLTPYGLRRTNASHLAQSIPIAEAAARLGHSVEVLTKHYVKRVAGQVALSNNILDNLYSFDPHSSVRLSSHSSTTDR